MRDVSKAGNCNQSNDRPIATRSILRQLHDSNEAGIYGRTNPFQGQRLGLSMKNYQQEIRDVIYQAVEGELAIFEAATIIEQIIRTEIDGE